MTLAQWIGENWGLCIAACFLLALWGETGGGNGF